MSLLPLFEKYWQNVMFTLFLQYFVETAGFYSARAPIEWVSWVPGNPSM